jgi:hypothetical protein
MKKIKDPTIQTILKDFQEINQTILKDFQEKKRKNK